MLTVLETITDFGAGRVFFLRSGQAARVGRTEWAEWALPTDTRMAAVHFLLTCEPQGCRIQDLSGEGTLVNNERTYETWLRTGDRIRAGDTTFVVNLEGCESTPCHAEDFAPAPTADTTHIVDGSRAIRFLATASPAQIAEWANLDDEPKARIQTTTSISEAVDKLLEMEPQSVTCAHRAETFEPLSGSGRQIRNEIQQVADAIGFLAFAMPTECGVRWACDSVELLCEKSPSDEERQAITAARQWIAEPTVEHRRVALLAAESAGMHCAASWAAAAAAWSNGPSIDANPTAATAPTVDTALANHIASARAVTGAVLLAALSAGSQHATRAAGKLIESGRTLVANGTSTDTIH